jgi:AcrR family transcriptional regulator
MGIIERKQRHKDALRDRILAAARDIVLREGFAALTLRKLAAAIEYAPGTIYLHFAGRDDIARQLCIAGFRELLAALQPAAAIADPRGRLEAILAAYIRFGIANPETYRLIFLADPEVTGAALPSDLLANPDDPGAQAFMLLARALEALRAEGRLAADGDAIALAKVLWAGAHGVVSLELTCAALRSTPAEDFGAAMIGALLDGIVRERQQ